MLHSLAKPREDRYQDAASFRGDLQNIRLGRAISPEATASLAALAAGATATLSTSEPTEVYAAQTRPRDDVPPAPVGGHATSTFPAAVQRPPRRDEHRGRRVVMITVALLTALALLGFGAMQYRAMQAEAAKVSVPPVEGKPIATALSDLRDAKAHLGHAAHRTQRHRPRGLGHLADPEAGRAGRPRCDLRVPRRLLRAQARCRCPTSPA